MTGASNRGAGGFGIAAFDVGLPAPLAAVSVHLDPFSPDTARAEAHLAWSAITLMLRRLTRAAAKPTSPRTCSHQRKRDAARPTDGGPGGRGGPGGVNGSRSGLGGGGGGGGTG
ncbi:hypothetical protein AB0O91_38110 [Kitasatospora sp. NPDC089797]|uniref:hypothetical protein n=1 Tax=Kitasatospora sp. NPDC089797 TaxID=3155298 RepID=UPI00344A35FE